MPDPNFFIKSTDLTFSDISNITGSCLISGNKEDIIKDVAPLDIAGPKDLTFLDNVKYKDLYRNTKAKACIVHPDMVPKAPKGLALFATETPYKAYALVCQTLYPVKWPQQQIAKSAFVDSSAKIGSGVVLEHGVVILENVELGEGCWVEANSVIGKSCTLGKRCHIGSNVTISHSLIGDNVKIYPGAKIGQDGFGFAIDPQGHIKVPQLGRVIIEDSVEIGANTCIDRGAGPDTTIGQGTWIDNLVQIGHNVKIGRGCVIVSQVGISGSTIIEDYVVLAGQVGVAGHLKIGKGSRIGAQAGVMKDVPPGMECLGSPAVPLKQKLRQIVAVERLSKKKSSS